MEKPTRDITVILNLYRREEYLEEQIKAIRNQNIQPKEIWLWINAHEDNKDFDASKYDIDKVFRNDYNWKYYGRFAAALLADTKYIAMFDDDTIPAPGWFINCMGCMEGGYRGILGGAGVKLNSMSYVDHERVGWNGQPPNEDVEEVDLVGHAWFFEREWLKYLWIEKPFTWDNGEDIQFSYCAKRYGGIKTFVPPHSQYTPHLHSSVLGWQYGTDDKASSNGSLMSIPLFYQQRDECVKHGIDNGWETVNDIAKLRH